ncbi:MAG: TMEM175 family protein, partial [Bacteroidota bacterium]|nr:TMEM175 family protein [Bacteroidota bacterium]
IPPSEAVTSTAGFWEALWLIAPSIGTFLLSFDIILITWVNHHGMMKFVDKSSAPFIYANGLLLLTVVFIPFPTSLMGEYLLTDHASPAVILLEVVLAVQSLGWIAVGSAALKGHLEKNAHAAAQIRNNMKFGYYALVVYTVCAVIAVWFPLAIAIITTIIWIFWLIFGLNLKEG